MNQKDAHGDPVRVMDRLNKQTVHLYAIADRAAGMVKIGRSRNPKKRLAYLQTSNGNPLTLCVVWRGCGPWEPDVHRRFSDKRVHGEWFRVDADLAEFVNDADNMDIIALNEHRARSLAKRRLGYVKEAVGETAYWRWYAVAAEHYFAEVTT
jgi:hypothetical protein